jgi:hypothetical protein
MIDISKVTDYLYVGSRISKEQADEVKLLNFDLIISMIAQMAPDEVYTLPPFKTLWIRTYDSIFLPIPLKKLITGVEAALPVIEKRGKVLVFVWKESTAAWPWLLLFSLAWGTVPRMPYNY